MWRLLNRISIRTKFIAGFALAFVWTLGLGGFAVDRLNAVEHAAAELRDGALQATVALSRIGQAAERLRFDAGAAGHRSRRAAPQRADGGP